MEEVQLAMWKLVAEVGHIIYAADDAAHVTTSLRYLASLLHNSRIKEKGDDDTQPGSVLSPETLDEISTLCRERAPQAFPETPLEEVLSGAFYNGPCFAALAQLLLRKVAVDWLAYFSLQEQTTLFDNFFTQGPISEAMSFLVQGLSLNEVSEDGESYSAVDSLSAACAQSERLLVLILISGQGVKKLALSMSSPNEIPEEASTRRSVLATYRHKSSQLAQLVSSMPDRTSLQAPASLQSPAPTHQTLLKCIGYSKPGKEHDIAIPHIPNEVPQVKMDFLNRHIACTYNLLFHSYLMRHKKTGRHILKVKVVHCNPPVMRPVSSLGKSLEGYADVAMQDLIRVLLEADESVTTPNSYYASDVIASRMVPSLMQHLRSATGSYGVAENQGTQNFFADFVEKLQMSFWPLLVASITDSHAVERLTEALIKEIASKADVTDWQACCVFHTLYEKLFLERATTRSLFTEKFLFAKMLPIRSLKWILDFAILQAPPASDHWVQPERNESNVQKNVVRRLAEDWATKEFIQSASVQQQAYLTAAVGICLDSMNKDALDGIEGLVPALLKGVSNRLDSPLIPVQNMAKRIALAFSTAMDPGNPLLFDENDNIEELLNWEGLEQQVGQKSVTPNNVGKKQFIAAIESDDGLQGSISHGDDKVRKFEQRRRRKAKEEKLALEEDDPDTVVKLGDGGSDDETEESSESNSDSDSELRPYDMSDGEDGISRGKFVTQLADLAINLRKGDKPDAVDEALQLAEKFVLAMPEELDDLASDLTHALVHVKCSGIAVDGEEDLAEERRQRSLLALLSCSSLQTLSVLTTELFSQHVDASQRILILDTMAAGARLLASGRQENKSLKESKGRQLITDAPGTTDLDSWYAPGDNSGPTGAGPWVEVPSPMPGGNLVGWAHTYERELPRKPGQKSSGRSRRWGHRAMQLRKDQSTQSSNQSRKNNFAPLAAAFMLPVMRDYDKQRRGLDLLGRDFHILGAILSMLGVCMECVTLQREAFILGASLLEMLRSRQISSHSETFVRRTALFAASRVLVALNPSDVAASLTAGVSSIVANLEWVREWTLDIAMTDEDADCSMMATACVQLHSEMALQVQRAMSSLEPSSQTLEAKIQTRSPIIMPF